MANTLLTPTIITREALRVLHQESHFIKTINRDYDDRFANSGASVSGKIGPSLQLRRPVKFTVRTGATLSEQDVQEYSTTLTVSTLIGIDWSFLDTDLTLTIDDFSKRYLRPAMSQLAAQLEYNSMAMYQQVWNQVGTPGTTPASLLVYLQAGQKLSENNAPRSDRNVIINPAAEAATVDALKALFHSNSELEEQYKEGTMGHAAGFDFYSSNLIRVHTVGPLGGTPLVNGASQSLTTGWAATASLITDGWTASAAARLKAGDIFTIANVFSVNPESRVSTGVLQQFVVTADVSSDGSGNLTAVISPAIISAGAYQNVNSVPADNAAITVTGTASTAYPINLAYYKDAFTLVTADLEVPKGLDMAARESFEGISLRFVRGFDITNNKRVCRFDLLYGFVAQRPELASRIIG